MNALWHFAFVILLGFASAIALRIICYLAKNKP